MTTNPTDTAAQAHHDSVFGIVTDQVKQNTADIIAAWLRATVACPQCQGTGDWVEADFHTGEAVQRPCPSPHTQITITTSQPNDHGCINMLDETDEILYADPLRYIGPWNNDPAQLVVPLPPGWTVT